MKRSVHTLNLLPHIPSLCRFIPIFNICLLVQTFREPLYAPGFRTGTCYVTKPSVHFACQLRWLLLESGREWVYQKIVVKTFLVDLTSSHFWRVSRKGFHWTLGKTNKICYTLVDCNPKIESLVNNAQFAFYLKCYCRCLIVFKENRPLLVIFCVLLVWGLMTSTLNSR